MLSVQNKVSSMFIRILGKLLQEYAVTLLKIVLCIVSAVRTSNLATSGNSPTLSRYLSLATYVALDPRASVLWTRQFSLDILASFSILLINYTLLFLLIPCRVVLVVFVRTLWTEDKAVCYNVALKNTACRGIVQQQQQEVRPDSTQLYHNRFQQQSVKNGLVNVGI